MYLQALNKGHKKKLGGPDKLCKYQNEIIIRIGNGLKNISSEEKTG